MNRKDIVKRAIRFNKPERLPISFPSQNDDDIYSLNYNETDNQPFCVGKDEWGCVWRTFDKTIGNVYIHPLRDLDQLRNFTFPNPHTSNRFDDAKKLLREKGIREYYLMGSVNFTLFERMHYLRGFSELLQDLYLNRDKVVTLAEIITDFQKEIIKGWANLAIDGLTFSDDWGTQIGPIINPLDWEIIFKPYYKELFTIAHENNMDVFFHSDGQICEFIDGLIDCGVDVLELPQPRLVGIERIAKKYGGKIAFYGCVDKQQTMVYGTLDDVEKEVDLLLESFACYDGGFIAREPGGGYFADYKALEIDPKKVRFAYNQFKKKGKLLYKSVD